MDAELKRRVDALRRPLELAAADSFAGVRKVHGLGNALRAACDGVLAKLGSEVIAGLDTWRATLARWEQLDEAQQAVEVARGMRLLARLPRSAPAAPPANKPNFTLPPLPAAARPGGSEVPVRSAAGTAPPSAATAVARAIDGARAAAAAVPASRTAIAARAVDGARAAASAASQAGATKPAGRPGDRARAATQERAAKPGGSAPESAAPAGSAAKPGDEPRAAAGTAPPPRAPASPRVSDDVRAPRQSATRSAAAARAVGAARDAAGAGAAARASASKATAARAVDAARDAAGAAAARKTGAARKGAAASAAPLGDRRVASGTAAPIADKAAAAGTAAPIAEPPATGTVAPIADRAAAAGTAAPIGDKRAAAGTAAPVADKPAAAPAPRAAGSPPRPRAAGPAATSDDVPAPDPLAAPTTSLPGIGPAFAEKLAEKGLTTVEDLLWMVPRRYDDVRDAMPLARVLTMAEGLRATFVARVVSARMIFARGRRWAEVRLAGIDAPGSPAPGGFAAPPPASALVRWFNMFAGIEKRMPAGCQVALSGVVRKRAGRLELANPDILGIELDVNQVPLDGVAAKPMPAIIARYPDIPGVPPGRLRAACASACARVAASAEDGVPPVVERAAGLPTLADTLAQLHAPSPTTAAADVAAMNRGDSPWQRRLAFGELFALGVAITLRRRERCSDAAVPCPRGPELAARLARALPFALTGAQHRAIDELAGDLARATPMNRLLQGDVGAGKTCVAFAAALQAAHAHRQTAVMAPTELLAEQHAETWRAWARPSGLRVELLTASTPRGIRASILALLAAGELDVLIGTHALIAESVGFHALGLVVIDEQHRFGVAQRTRLRDKGDGQGAPHLLVMTATPIPRTLALTAYGDLDVSVLDELPPGRKPVTTRLLAGTRGVATAYKLVAERVAAGERAYIVCPKVEPNEPDDGDDSRAWKDATTVAAEVAAALPAVRTGLVHGRLDGVARDRVMRAFKAGELDVLVATTVIEVGVDVPAATVMVIHDAERFGLAQLHQLRGRVGRGGAAAHCLLLSQGRNGEDAQHRLDAMVATHDGFRIAEEDLALRGPGELLGPKQAGVPRLRFGSLAQHTELLLEARRHAEAVLADDPGLAHPDHAALRRALERRLAQTVYGAEGG